MSNPAPGFGTHPDHTLTFEFCQARATVGNTVIAQSDSAVLLHEGNYPAVVYFPKEGLNSQHFKKTNHSTYCPFKGHASYWTLEGLDSDKSLQNAVWAYEDPYDECEQIRDHASFYSDRVNVERLSSDEPSAMETR